MSGALPAGPDPGLTAALALVSRGRGRESEARRVLREERLAVLSELADGPWFPARQPRYQGEALARRMAVLEELRGAGIVEESSLVRWHGHRPGPDGTRVPVEQRDDAWALTGLGRRVATGELPGLGPGDDMNWMPSDIVPFAALRALDQDGRRRWLRGWMARLRLTTAHQASAVLTLSRQSVERMLYPGSAERTAVTDQTLRIAYLSERVAPNWD